MKTYIMFLAAFVTLISSGASAKESKQITKLFSMTPEAFASAVLVKDDALETSVALNTSKAFQETHGLLKIVWSDIFLRSFIDKSNGSTTYQVYARLLYVGPSWPRFERANFALPNRAVNSVELVKINSDVDCSLSQYSSGCSYVETVAFEITENDIKSLAITYSPTARNAMVIRFKGQSGVDSDMSLVPAEAAGLLKVTAEYQNRYHSRDAEQSSE